MLRRTLLLCAALFAVVALAGCGGDDDSAATKTETAGEAIVSAKSPAADLRLTLDRLLGEHAMLAMFATQKGLKGEKDFAATGAALDQNSVELADAIGSVYGDEARAEFLDGPSKWRDHIKFFVNYTTALAKKDKAGQDKAVSDLTGYIESFSAFLATATGLPKPAMRESITMHVNQLKGQIDAYAAGDYTQAYRQLR